MTTSEIIKQLFASFNSKDEASFISAAKQYIEREKRKKHNIVAKDLEKVLYDFKSSSLISSKKFKNTLPIPRDNDKGFPLLEIQHPDRYFDNLIVDPRIKEQVEQIIQEFKDADILSTYNLTNKNKILFCGKPGTGKTFTAQILSSTLQIPLVYIRFDAIISSYLGETAGNLRKVFDFIENGTWIVLFDEVDIIGKNRDDSHEHGEIKRVVNNFLQMLDNFKGNSILLAATNHQHILDSAIWRRFDDVIYFEVPDENSRMKLINLYLKSIKHDNDLDISIIVEKTKGLSPSDIKMIAEEAMKLAIIGGQQQLGMRELNKAVSKFTYREKVKNNEMGTK